ncbi:hypothetical protein HDU99_008910, partial [Rhizoclosmatium hyalinum]
MFLPNLIGAIVGLSPFVLAQQNIDVGSKDAVAAAAKAAMGPLQQYFNDNQEGNGAWIEQYGGDGQ